MTNQTTASRPLPLPRLGGVSAVTCGALAWLGLAAGCATAHSPGYEQAPGPDAAVDEACGARASGWQTLEAGFVADVDPTSEPSRVHVMVRGSGEIAYAMTEGQTTLARQWSGQVWTPLGATINLNAGTTPGYAPFLAETSGGRLVMSVSEAGSPQGVGLYLLELAASGWQMLGGGHLNSASSSVFTAPVVTDGEEITVLWSQYFDANTIGKSRINAKRWIDGTMYTLEPSVGQVKSPGGSAIVPRAVVDGNRRLWLAFQENDVHVRYRDPGDSAWQSLPVEPGVPGVYGPHLAATAAGAPVVAYTQYVQAAAEAVVYVARFGGTSWELLAELDETEGHSTSMGVAVHESQLVTAWMEGPDGARQLCAADITGATLLLGAPRGTAVIDAALAVDACGDVVVAYIDGAVGSRQVKVERFHR